MEIHFALAGVSVPWPVLLLLGVAIGALMGFFGLGGGFLATPALNILGFPIPYAIGTSLAYVGSSAVLGTLRHYRLGNLGVRTGGILGLSGMVGMELSRRLVLELERHGLADSTVRLAYLLLLSVLGLGILAENLLRRLQQPSSSRTGAGNDTGTTMLDEEPARGLSRWILRLRTPPLVRLRRSHMTVSLWVLVSVGLLVGLVGGFLGSGGGFLIVPALLYVLGTPTRVAVASGLLSVLLVASYGAVSYGLEGRVEVVAAALMLVGALLGAQVGAMATSYAAARDLRGLLGLTLLLVGAAVLLRELQLPLASSVLMFGTALAMTALIVGLLLNGLRRARL